MQGRLSGKLQWHGLAKVGDRLRPRGGEQYLGVLVAHNLCNKLEDVHASADKLLDLISQPAFVRELGRAKVRRSVVKSSSGRRRISKLALEMGLK